MRGPAPWRRSLEYLKNGIEFRKYVKVFAISYHDTLPESDGLRRFVFWHLPQIQYNNPKIQCVQFKNMTHTPYISFFTTEKGNVNRIDINCYKRTPEEILNACNKLMGKPKDSDSYDVNIANFNFTEGKRNCICQIEGQVACPRYKLLPMHLRGKYRISKKSELEEFRKKVPDCEAMTEYWNSA